MKKSLSALIFALSALVLSACGSTADTTPNNAAITQIIDVRTAAEFDAGHVANAVNIDVEAGEFDQAITQLDPAGTYLVYCRSGRRSAIAADKMGALGLTVLDGGALDAMLASGWQIGS